MILIKIIKKEQSDFSQGSRETGVSSREQEKNYQGAKEKNKKEQGELAKFRKEQGARTPPNRVS